MCWHVADERYHLRGTQCAVYGCVPAQLEPVEDDHEKMKSMIRQTVLDGPVDV